MTNAIEPQDFEMEAAPTQTPSSSLNRFFCQELVDGNVCGHPFPKRYNLKRHILRKHAVDIEKIKCDKCPKVFKTREDLQAHKRKDKPANPSTNRFVVTPT